MLSVGVLSSDAAPPTDHIEVQCSPHNSVIKNIAIILLHTLKDLSFLRKQSLLFSFLYTVSALVFQVRLL